MIVVMVIKMVMMMMMMKIKKYDIFNLERLGGVCGEGYARW